MGLLVFLIYRKPYCPDSLQVQTCAVMLKCVECWGKKNNPGRNPKENTNNKNINLLKLLLNNRFIIVIFTSLAPSDVKQTDGV